MKRRSLFNRIISLSIVAVLFLTSSASAFADVDEGSAPAVEETVESSEEAAISDVPATEEAVVPSEENSSIGEVVGEIVDKVAEVIGGDSQTPKEGSEATDEANKDEAVGENPEGNPEGNPEETQEGEPEGDPKEDPLKDDEKDKTEDGETDEEKLDEEKLDEEAKDECEHELVYTSNGDGTHTVKCSKCDMEEYTESCEFDEDGKCIHCGFERLPEPVLTYEDDEVIVTVKGAVPENADLKVTPIKKDVEETAEAFEEVAAKVLENTEVENFGTVGFIAYDICFINIETKEEVEPDGDVTISMEYKQHALPIDNLNFDEVESVDVSVIHINEETGTVDDLTKENKAELKLDGEKAISNAEFTSDTFSTYVFTYTANMYEQIRILFNNIDRNDQNLSDVSTTVINHRVTSASQVDNIGDFVEAIPGYRFLEARYTDPISKETVTFNKFKYETKQTGSNGWGSVYSGFIRLYQDDTAVTDSIEIAGELLVDMIYEKALALTITKKATGDPAADDETEYEFRIVESGTNAPAANKRFKVGNTDKSTDSNGVFTLKAGESADFATFDSGTYIITETRVVESQTEGDVEGYKLSDFKTMIFVNGELFNGKPYSPEYTGERNATFTIEENNLTDIIVKNYYYTKEEVSESQEILSKYIKYDPDAKDYNLQLKFVGPEKVVEETSYEIESESVIEPKHLNIVLVIDRSGSMGSRNRASHIQQATQLMAEVFKTKKHVEAKWKIVDFGSYANLASATSNWVDTDTFYGIVSKKGTNRSYSGAATDPYNNDRYGFDWYYDGYDRWERGGTNYEGALLKAKDEIATAEANVEKVIIFLTDGVPTMYNESGGGQSFTATAYTRALSAAEGITCNAFYSIGVDFDNTPYQISRNTYLYAADMLKNITAKVNATTKSDSTVDAENIPALFRSIAGKISSVTTGEEITETTTYRASNVVITDPLSEYVDIEPGSEFYISVEIDNVDIWQSATYINGKIGADGKQLNPAIFYLEDGGTHELKAEYDAEGRTMKMTIPSDYELKPNYAFKLSFQVIPSDTAYEEYLNSGYNAVGDPNTDNETAQQPTSSLKDGFYSNDKAIVSYEFQGNNPTPEFPHPVIQVYVINEWNLYKTDGFENPLGGAKFKLAVKDNPQESYEGTSKLDTPEDKGIVKWGSDGTQVIPTGKTYTLTEESPPLGYLKCTDYWEIEISEDNVPTVNAYKEDETEGEYEMVRNRNGNVVTYSLYFKNVHETYSLPETGGNGIYRTTLYGIVLMLTSVFLFYRNKKKSKVCIK
ncbi:DUF7604 domain-containing protein [Pseudobutyrivibrio xylanivorans]|uniref:LPXTG-motif cell wall anchor domain-containing protein n=1 Tax=Pseudobutyrivibrio xylanivorans DSM 14809 TaxID=1123012 RepID=A0A1M6DPV5_PSEXY|nr:SpaA isopeptide-forming pilin-related protein [Pseudobutyrivibrio xylanivorans]SHI75220.1 LPXTG-motif cell wall anchor domain-containing protein [Pseudobutyrivibrio xylanivorans DSM 14809]